MLLSDDDELLSSSLLYIVSQYSFVPNLHLPSLLRLDAKSLVAIVHLCLLFLQAWPLFAHSHCLREIDVGWKVNEETKGSNSKHVNMEDKIMLLLLTLAALSGR